MKSYSCILVAPHSAMLCWQLEISHGGSIYSMESGKHSNQGSPFPLPESWLLNTCQPGPGCNLLGEAASISWAGGMELSRVGGSCEPLAANTHSSKGFGERDLDRAPTVSSILQQVTCCFIRALTRGILSFCFCKFPWRGKNKETEIWSPGFWSWLCHYLALWPWDSYVTSLFPHPWKRESNGLSGGIQLCTASDYVILLATWALVASVTVAWSYCIFYST